MDDNASTVGFVTYIESADWLRDNYFKSGVAHGYLERLILGPPETCTVPTLPEGVQPA